MFYREIPSSGEPLPALGMGCMRLPETPDGKVDEAAAVALIRAAIDGGATYIDTAWPYHDGESERIVGLALADGYRERAFLATKLPSWKVESREEMDRYLDEQLRRLGTDHLDAYLVHALTRRRWNRLWDLEVDTFLDEAKADGRIRYAGFSFHDDLSTFRTIVDAYAWDLCQVQYNYLDEHYQAGTEGIRYAAKKGLAVVVMEPLRGGLLGRRPPAEVEEIFAAAPVRRSPAEWGLRWVLDHSEVTTVLSGMGTTEELDENLRVAATVRPGTLSPEEHRVVERVRKVYEARLAVPCTGCHYCMPCPCKVNIPECFAQVNNAALYDDPAYAKFFYRSLLGEGGAASWCTECGMCLSLCPQGIEIPAVLKKAVALFEDEMDR